MTYPIKLFVYNNLREHRPGYRQFVDRGAKLLGWGRAPGYKLYRAFKALPIVIPTLEAETYLQGDVFEVTPQALEYADSQSLDVQFMRKNVLVEYSAPLHDSRLPAHYMGPPPRVCEIMWLFVWEQALPANSEHIHSVFEIDAKAEFAF